MKKILAFLILSAACFAQTAVTGAGGGVTHVAMTPSGPISNTGDTNEDTKATFTIPANLSKSAVVQVYATYANLTGNTGTCTLLVKYSTASGGTGGYSSVANNVLSSANTVSNVSGGLKVTGSSSGVNWGTGGNNLTIYSTTVPQYINFNIKNSVAADTCQLVSADVFITYQ